ncbi:MAG: DNA cytosine methyltransferase [Sulfurospirillum sp.]|nr:DNA cytosine methyltransferase [Sulfurospirillum sp.]
MLFSFALVTENIIATSIAFVLFSLLASSIYVLNDLVDIQEDREHPKKKDRPLASGKVSPKSAKLLIFTLATVVFIFAFLKDILEKDNGQIEYLEESEYTLIESPKKQPSGLIFVGYRNKKIRTKGTRPDTIHLSRVHKQPNRIYSSDGTHPTLSSQESAGRYFVYHDNKVRKLTLKECYRLMGFKDDFKLIGSKAKLYNRVGNSIVIPMVKEIAKQVKEQILNKTDEIIECKKLLKQMSLFDFDNKKDKLAG